jgi:hypothetical protein
VNDSGGGATRGATAICRGGVAAGRGLIAGFVAGGGGDDGGASGSSRAVSVGGTGTASGGVSHDPASSAAWAATDNSVAASSRVDLLRPLTG